MKTSVPPQEPQDRARMFRTPRIKRIPLRVLLPNLITILAICAGLSGVRLAFENRFEIAVIMVLLAAFLDGIDGRIARMLNATSKFGAEMDSLADIVNFGAAPAMVLYAYMLDRAGNFGWIAALLFAIACGLRLARFNIQTEDTERPPWQGDYFTGVPAPAGGVLVMLPIYLGFLGVEVNTFTGYVASGYTVVIAGLLVSTLPVYSAKSTGVRVRGDAVIPLMMGFAFYVLLLVSYPWQTMAASAVAYLAFLPISYRMYANRLLAERREADVATVASTNDGACSDDAA